MAVEAIQDQAEERSAPTDDRRQKGAASLCDVELSVAEYWIDGPDHVIQSLEFEVIAAADNFDQALARFLSGVIEYAVYLGELEDPAENEEEMFHRLSPRLARAFQRFEHRDTALVPVA